MSTKPGVTSRPLASISSAALPDTLPMAAILPSFTAMSASCSAAPVPSARVPPRTTRSKSVAMFFFPRLCRGYLKWHVAGMLAIRMADTQHMAQNEPFQFANRPHSARHGIADHKQRPGDDPQGHKGPSPVETRRSSQVFHSPKRQRRNAAQAARLYFARRPPEASAPGAKQKKAPLVPRRPRGERRRLLQRRRGPQHRLLIESAADDLQAQRQAVLVEAGRHRDAGQAGHRGGNGEHVVEVHGYRIVHLLAGGERRRGRGRRQQNVAFLEGLLEVARDQRAYLLGLLVIGVVVAGRQ